MARATAVVLSVIFALVARASGRDYARTTISCATTGAPIFRNGDALALAVVENILAGNTALAIRILLHGKIDPSVSHIIPADDTRVVIETLTVNNARGSRPMKENEILSDAVIYTMDVRLARNDGPTLAREDAENNARVAERLAALREQHPMK